MNKIKIFISALFITLLLTGCGKTPEEILSEAGDNMAALDNYHMLMDMDVKMSYEGSTFSMGATINFDVDEKNGNAHMEMSTSAFGITVNAEGYTTIQNGKTITYTLQEDEWYKEESEVKEDEFDFNIFKDATNIEELEDQENTYKISLTEEQLKALLNNIDSEQTDTEGATIDVNNVNIEVTVIDGYVTKMVLDMPMTAESEGITFDSNSTLTIEFSKFNEVGDVTIPADVTENAIDLKIYEIATYAESYISEIGWDVIFAEEDMTYTNTALEYNGPAPSKVEVSIVDGEVTDGTIEIEGYRVTIVDGSVSDVNVIE